MADSNFVVKNGLVANGSFTANSTQFGITSAVVANTTTISIGTATINAVSYTGTANNALYLGGTAAASYQLNSTLSANVAKLTANNTSFVGSVSAANVVSNAQLSANLANYQTESGLAANVAILSANNASYLGTVAAASYARLDTTDVFAANVTVGSTSSETDAGFGVGTSSSTSNGAGNRLVVATDIASPNKNWYNAQTALTIANGSLTLTRTYMNQENLLINYSLGKNSNGTQLSTVFYGNHQYLWNADSTGGDAFSNTMYGFNADVRNYANGTTNSSINYAYGLYSTIRTFASGKISTATGVFSSITPASANATVTGTIGTAKAFSADLGIESGNASIGTAYMYYGEYNASANVTTKWGVYTTGETKNYFSGTVGIGNTSPAAALSVNGGVDVGAAVSFYAGGSVDGTYYTGTANNTIYVGSITAGNVVSNAQLSANLANYQTTAGLSANVAKLTANNTTYAYGKAESALNVNSALTANNANYLGGVAAASYQTEAGLSANVATLTANNANYLGGTAAASYQLNSTLSANVAKLAANNASYLGGTAASGYQTTAGLSANVAKLAANNASYLGGVAAANYARVDTNESFAANVTIAVNKQLTVGNTAAAYGVFMSNSSTAQVTLNGVSGNVAYLTPQIISVPSANIGMDDSGAPAGTELAVSGTAHVSGSITSGTSYIAAATNLYSGYNRAADGSAGVYLTSAIGTNTHTSFIRASGTAGTLTLRHGGNGTFSIITNATNATSGGTTAMTFNYLQDITIPNGDLAVTGNITATGNITPGWCDKRLKKELKYVAEEWKPIIDGLTPYWFKWNDTALDLMRNKDTKTQIGFIAQDVQKVLPQAVTEQTATPADKVPEDGQYLTIMQEKIIPVLVAAVKDLTSEIDILKAELAKLKE